MKILEDIEPEVVFKSVLWTIFIVIFIAYFVNTHILPAIYMYKNQQHNNNSSNVVLSQIKSIYNTEEINLNTITNNNKDVLNVFYARANTGIIEKMLQKHFSKISITQLKEADNEELNIKEIRYQIKGESNSVEKIIGIPNILQDNNISAVLTLPLTIHKKVKNSDILSFVVHISVTKSTYNHSKNIFK